MQKLWFKLCNMLLVVVMVVNMLPMTAWAEEQETTSTNVDLSTAESLTTETSEDVDMTEAQIVGEIIEKRTEYSKDFLLDNGLHISAVYADPVHYQENGQWEEIDNTLVASLDGSLTNTDGAWDVSFPQQLTQGNPVTITKDGYTLSFNMSGELRNQGNLEVMSVEDEENTFISTTEDEIVSENFEENLQGFETISGEELISLTEGATTPSVENEEVLEAMEIAPETQEESIPEETESVVSESTEEGTETVSQEAELTETAPQETIVAETIPEEAFSEEIILEETASNISEEMDEEPILEVTPMEPGLDTASVTIDGIAQTFTLSKAQASTAAVQTIDVSEAKKAAEFEELVIEKGTSRLMYENVYANTDVQYDLQGNKVKESIILDSYDQDLRGYRYTLNVGDMVPVLYSDGTIEFYDSQQKEIVMFMPAPYLVDHNGEMNHDIHVSLTGGDGTYNLTYVLPTTWLAESERAWPVVLDPVVQTHQTYYNIHDRTVVSTGSVATDDFLYCGYGAACHKHRTFVMYGELPSLTSADVIVNAQIAMHCASVYSSSGVVIGVHKVSDTWVASELTWSNKPGYGSTIQDYAVVTGTGKYTWDVTEIVRDWYADENTGMMFKALDEYEDGSAINWKKFYNSECGTVSVMPTLTIVYRNNNGLESYWDYTTSSAGRAGTGYVNTYTGNMVWSRNDIGFGGNRMPVSISHIYNLNDAANNSFGMGYGWRTNFNQLVYTKTLSGTTYYVWEDADGTAHYFKYSSSSTYKDEDGLELTLKTNGSGTNKYSITDKYGNISYFDTYGRLTSQQNNQATKSKINIYYTTTSGRLIDYITDGVEREYHFSYDSNNLLKKIEYYGYGTGSLSNVSFAYSSNNLTKVTDNDGKYSTYSYGSNHILTAATDTSGYSINYTYYTPSKSFQPYRAKKILEKDGSVSGGELNFEYSNNQTTLTDVNGNVQIIQFNNWGNVTCIQDDQGHAQFAQYANNKYDDTQNKTHQLNLSSKLQNTVGNRFKQSSFETGHDFSAESGSGSFAVSTNASYNGNQSLAITNDLLIRTSYLNIAAGRTETFSAYVKTGTTTAQLEFYDGTNTYVSEVLPANSNWTRLQVTYTNTGTAGISVAARVKTTGTGTTYVDCVQWEYAATASRFNLVENGDYRNSNHAWSSNTGRTTKSPAAAPELTTNAYQMTGSPTAKSRIYQTVKVKGSKDDTFVLAGWAKGDSATLKDNRQFAVIGTFNYTDGTTSKEFVAQFNPDTNAAQNWQYAAQVMVAEKAYSSIKIQLAYDYNVNTVYFDGIQLYKEEFGNSYTYDTNGNITSVKDLQSQTTTYEYTNNNLTEETLPTGAKLTYTYDSYHNVKTATTAEGLVYEFTYDTYGNNTAVSIKNGSSKITSTATYSNSGNTLASTKDAIGNVTTYSYNANTNVLEYVRYPEDTASTQTNYTYDTMYRLASAAATSDLGSALTATYTYNSDDLLSSIATDSTTYSFNYGNFGLRSNIKIGSRTLATYTYTSDRNNYLQKLAYGNGDSVQYTYDDQGRVTKQTYEDGATVTYQYDNSGALATVTDSETGIKTTYYYDFTDRLLKYVESADGYSHSVGYEYDNINNLTKLVETINGTDYTTSYTYDDDNRVSSVTSGSATKNYTYDAYGRGSTQTTKNGTATIKTDSYTFKNPTSTTSSGQIDKHTVSSTGYSNTNTYTYDANGNIATITDSSGKVTRYTYDTANQLVREDNQAGGYTYLWIYDDAGNIERRVEYAYTTGLADTPLDTVIYTYGESAWGDLLTAYDGQTITYDTIGNPLTDGTWTYTWQHGRQLASMTGNGTVTFEYNADGLRVGKTVENVTVGSGSSHTHSYTSTVVAPTCNDAGYTLYQCSCGDYYKSDTTSARGHFFSTANCTRCGAANHTHSYTSTVVEATCQSLGYTLYQCSSCVDSYKTNETAFKSHFFPSATSTTCTRCGYVRTIEESEPTPVNAQYRYVYNGSSLSQMSVTTDGTTQTLNFAYDASGVPLTVTYNNATYYYITNVQGDVIGILNSSAALVVSYTYDAWGNPLTTTGTMKDTLGALNPLRYRGYVFDSDTQLYYLQSRYYDPELGRFLNADNSEYLGADGTLTGYNLFAYCANNPLNRFDDNGNLSLPNWAKVTIGAVAIAGLAVATVCTGGAAAVICGAALSGAIAGGASGAVMGAIGGGISGGWQGALDGACSGFMSGTLIGGVTGAASAGLNIATGATTVVGNAHGSTLHKLATNMEAGKMAASGQYSQIGVNKALKTMGLNGTSRPDVIGVAKNGMNKLVEVVSPRQSTNYIINKMSNMLSNNPGSVGKIVNWVRRLFK